MKYSTIALFFILAHTLLVTSFLVSSWSLSTLQEGSVMRDQLAESQMMVQAELEANHKSELEQERTLLLERAGSEEKTYMEKMEKKHAAEIQQLKEEASASQASEIEKTRQEMEQVVTTLLGDLREKHKEEMEQLRIELSKQVNGDSSNAYKPEIDYKSGVVNSNLLSKTQKWENSTVLPVWFKNYVALHREQRLALNETNWKDQRYLIMRCLDIDNQCGGASDRLQSIPTLLALANKIRRMFFIKWSRPAPLQEFLVPPKGGLDWTFPDWIDQQLDFRELPMATGNPPRSIQQAKSSVRIVTFRHQNYDHGANYYNEQRSDNEPAFNHVFREMWDTLFIPSPPVAALIRPNMNDLNLVPGEYVAAHIRSMYTGDKSSNADMIRNGVNCATHLKPGWPIYFASDSSSATRFALRYGRSKNGTIVARIAATEPLHLDRGIDFLRKSDGWKNLSASAFYGVFVDLYLLAGSQCVAHGVGGYGKWGSLLSYNSSCVKGHFKSQCTWTEPVSSYSTS
jgi:hypothetical protein